MDLLEEFLESGDFTEGLVAKDIAKFMIEKAFAENPEEPECPIIDKLVLEFEEIVTHEITNRSFMETEVHIYDDEKEILFTELYRKAQEQKQLYDHEYIPFQNHLIKINTQKEQEIQDLEKKCESFSTQNSLLKQKIQDAHTKNTQLEPQVEGLEILEDRLLTRTNLIKEKEQTLLDKNSSINQNKDAINAVVVKIESASSHLTDLKHQVAQNQSKDTLLQESLQHKGNIPHRAQVILQQLNTIQSIPPIQLDNFPEIDKIAAVAKTPTTHTPITYSIPKPNLAPKAIIKQVAVVASTDQHDVKDVASDDFLRNVHDLSQMPQPFQELFSAAADHFANQINEKTHQLIDLYNAYDALESENRNLINQEQYEGDQQAYLVSKQNRIPQVENALATIETESERLSEEISTSNALDKKLKKDVETLNQIDRKLSDQIKTLDDYNQKLLVNAPLYERIKTIMLEEQVNALTEDLEKVNQEATLAHQAAEDARKTTQELSKQLEEAEHELASLHKREEESDFRNQVTPFNAEMISAQQPEMAALYQKSIENESLLSAIRLELSQKLKALQRAEDNAAALFIKTKQLIETEKTLSAENEQYLATNDQLTAQLSAQAEKARKTTETVNSLQESLLELQQAHHDDEQKVKLLSSENAKIIATNTTLKQTITDLSSDIKTIADKLIAEQKKVKTATALVEDTQKALKLAEEKANTLIAETIALRQDHKIDIEKLKTTTSETELIKTQLADQTEELLQRQSIINTLEIDLNRLKEKNTEILSQNEVYLSQNATLNDQLTSQALQVSATQQSLLGTQEALSNLENVHETLIRRADLLDEINKELSTKVSQLETAVSDLENKLVHANKALEAESKKIIIAQKETTQATSSLAEAQTIIVSLRTEATEREANFKQAISELSLTEKESREQLEAAHIAAMATLNEKLVTYEDSITQLTSQITQKNTEIDGHKNALKLLKTELKTLQGEHQTLKEQHATSLTTNEGLETQLKLARDTLSISEANLQQLTTSHSQLEAGTKQLELEAITLRTMNSELNQTVITLTSDINKVSNELAAELKKVETASKLVKETEASLVIAETKIQSLTQEHETDIEKLKKADLEIHLIKTQLANQTDELNQRQNAINALTTELESLKIINTTLTKENDGYLLKNEELTQQLLDAENLAHQIGEDLETSNELNQQLSAKADELDLANKELNSKIIQLETSVSELETRLNIAIQELGNSAEKIATAQKETESTKLSLDLAKKTIETLELEATKRQLEFKQSIKMLSDAEQGKRDQLKSEHIAEMDALNQKLLDAKEAVAGLSGALLETKLTIDEYINQLATLTTKFDRLQTEHTELKAQYSESEKRNHSLNDQLNRQEIEMAAAKKALLQSEQNLTQLTTRNTKLDQLANELFEKNKTLVAQNEILILQVEHLTNQFDKIKLKNEEDFIKTLAERVQKADNVLMNKAENLSLDELDEKIDKHQILIDRLSDEYLAMDDFNDERVDELLERWEYIQTALLRLRDVKDREQTPPITNHQRPLNQQAYPNIFYEKSGGMQSMFKDEYIHDDEDEYVYRPDPLRNGVTISYEVPAPTVYEGRLLTEGDCIRSTVAFKRGVDEEPAVGLLKQDHTGKVVDLTQDNLTNDEKEVMALKQAKMLLTNCDVTHMTNPAIVIRGTGEEDKAQAGRVWAALLLLKKDNRDFDRIKIVSKIRGVGEQMIGPAQDAAPAVNDAFIRKHLSAKLIPGGEVAKDSLQNLGDFKHRALSLKLPEEKEE